MWCLKVQKNVQQKTCNLVCNIAVKWVEWRCCHFTTRFKPVNNLICCKTGFMWVVKHTTFLFNLFCSYVAKQVACFLLPIFPYLNLSNAHALIQDGRYPPILCPSLVQISLSCIREVYCIPLICNILHQFHCFTLIYYSCFGRCSMKLVIIVIACCWLWPRTLISGLSR